MNKAIAQRDGLGWDDCAIDNIDNIGVCENVLDGRGSKPGFQIGFGDHCEESCFTNIHVCVSSVLVVSLERACKSSMAGTKVVLERNESQAQSLVGEV